MLNFFLPAETMVIPTAHFSCANAIGFFGCSMNYVSEMTWVRKQQAKGRKLHQCNVSSSTANSLVFLHILLK